MSLKIIQEFSPYVKWQRTIEGNFFNEEIEISSMKELEAIDWVKSYFSKPNFKGLYISDYSEFPTVGNLLIAMSNEDPDYGGCKTWEVIGRIYGDYSILGLEDYKIAKGDHHDSCPQKYRAILCTCGFNEY